MLANRGGTVINISSSAAHRALEGWSAYCCAKAGLAMLTTALALETTRSGVRVFGLAPGVVDTDMQVTIRASSSCVFCPLRARAGAHARGHEGRVEGHGIPPTGASGIVTETGFEW